MTMLSFSSPDWVDELLASYKNSMEIQELLKKEKDNSTIPKGYKWQNGLLLKKGSMVVLDQSLFKPKVLLSIHHDLIVGQMEYLKTYQRAKRDFYWKGMRKDIKNLVQECDICPSGQE